MTEAEWLTGEDLFTMLGFVRDRTSERKQRLVSCAYSRRVWHLLCDIGRGAVQTSERYADGEITHETATAVQERVQALLTGEGVASPYSPVAWSLQAGREQGSSYPPYYAAGLAALNVQDVLGTAQSSLADVIRDIFGNPFRPVALDPAWLTSTVVALASQMYESRDFSEMPILADALQDAGCDNPDMLDHCRGAGPHVRGCWVVDLTLGKA